jgi:hypothetical protein
LILRQLLEGSNLPGSRQLIEPTFGPADFRRLHIFPIAFDPFGNLKTLKKRVYRSRTQLRALGYFGTGSPLLWVLQQQFKQLQGGTRYADLFCHKNLHATILSIFDIAPSVEIRQGGKCNIYR